MGDLSPANQRAPAMSRYATWMDLGVATGPLVGYLLGVGLGLECLYRAGAVLLLGGGLVYLLVFGFRTDRSSAPEGAKSSYG